jgi:protein phosphatase
MREGEEQAFWNKVPVVGKTPGRRYGHILSYTKPYLITFGGNTGAEAVCDFWCLNVEKSPFSWTKLASNSDIPSVRVYHSAAYCNSGSANGMIVIFGGRTKDGSALNDTWGLRRHRNGKWDWVRAPYSYGHNKTVPKGRYQQCSLFIESALIIFGGRTNSVNEHLGMEVYDTENSEWYRFQTFQRFRAGSWIFK